MRLAHSKVLDAMGKVGIVICYDRHFPESIRTCALKGAQLILIPTVNTSSEPRDLYAWELRVAAMHTSLRPLTATGSRHML